MTPKTCLQGRLLNETVRRGMKLGLANVQAIDAALGHTHKEFDSIHVAGTNGKGSVVYKIAMGLQFAGKKVGMFTSPHISCFRERIQINGEMISEEDVEELLAPIYTIADKENIPATFFEVTTLLAFSYFAKEGVEIAVIETGLGGRLDATNIIQPILSIITSISQDHTNILGESLEQIAEEKAGIIKERIPILIGPNVPAKVIAPIAQQKEAPLKQMEGSYALPDEENSAIAEAALKTLNTNQSCIQQALQQRPPCRFQVIHTPKPIILDVAHNPDGLRALFATFRKRYPTQKPRIIFGLSKDKDAKRCLEVIKKENCPFHLVQGSHERCMPLATLQKEAFLLNFEKNRLQAETSLRESILRALQEKEFPIICGSFFMMDEVIVICKNTSNL